MREIPDERIYDYDEFIAGFLQYEENAIGLLNQTKEIIASGAKKVLEIGVGLGLTKVIVQKLTNCEYHTLDFNEKLSPDYVGSVLALPFPDDSYELVCAFFVLEHLPFSDFERGLSEICRVASDSVIFGLPNGTHKLCVDIRPRGNVLCLDLPFWKRKMGENHHWEINAKGYPEKKIRNTIKEIAQRGGFVLERDFRSRNSPYGHYFTLKKRK